MKPQRKLPRTRSVLRVDEIVRQCRGKSVLNIGMGGWVESQELGDRYLTQDALQDSVHYRIGQVAARLVGTDILADSLGKMARLVPGDYVCADLMAADFASHFPEQFDIVVFAEVIEHLDDFRTALANIRAVLKPGGLMVLTTANAFSADRIAKMLLNYEANHEEHTSYFSFMTIRRLLEMNRFRIRRFDFHTERPFRSCTRSRFALYYAMRGLTAVMPQFSEGIFVIAEPVPHVQEFAA